jgi:uncharacterized membrane protein
MLLRFLAGLAAFAASLSVFGQAGSQWQICNRTSEDIWAAAGVGNKGPGPISTSGWHGLKPGNCKTLNFKGIYQEAHLHARSRSRYFAISNDPEYLCVVEGQNFTIPDARRRCDRNQPKILFYTVTFSGNRLVSDIRDSMGFAPKRPQRID